MPRELIDHLATSKYNRVQSDTWVHLAPERGRKYAGHIIVAHGEYGDVIPFRAHFDGLPDSPWFFADLTDYVTTLDTKEGGLYRFDGTYTVQKNGYGRFSGKVRRLAV